jgi:hypothetical protein
MQIALPSAETLFMSITTVFFDSKEVYAGQYHKVSTTESGSFVVVITPYSIPMGIPSNWRACLSERIGKEQAGHLWRQEHITILVQGVAEESLCSFCLLAELRTMRSRESRSLRASDCVGLFQ